MVQNSIFLYIFFPKNISEWKPDMANIKVVKVEIKNFLLKLVVKRSLKALRATTEPLSIPLNKSPYFGLNLRKETIREKRRSI